MGNCSLFKNGAAAAETAEAELRREKEESRILRDTIMEETYGVQSSPNGMKFWTIGDLHPMADLPAGAACCILCANRDVVVVLVVDKKMLFFVPTSPPSSSSASFAATVSRVRVPSVTKYNNAALSPSGRRLVIHSHFGRHPPPFSRVCFALIDAADAHFTRDVIVREYVISRDSPLSHTFGVFFAGDNDDATCSLVHCLEEPGMRAVSLMPAKRAMRVEELATNTLVQEAYTPAVQGQHILQQLPPSTLAPDNSMSIRVLSFNSLSSYTRRDFRIPYSPSWLGIVNIMSGPSAHPERVRFLTLQGFPDLYDYWPNYIAHQQEDGAFVFSKLVLPPGKYEEIVEVKVEQEPSDNLYFIVHFADKGAMLVRGRLRDSHSLASLARAAYYKSAAHREHGLLLDCGLQPEAAPRYRLQTK